MLPALAQLPTCLQDGPLYHPVVVILSLQNPAVVRFARKRRDEQQSECVKSANQTSNMCAPTRVRTNKGGQASFPTACLLALTSATGNAAAAAEGAESHGRAGQLVASVACMPRSLLIFK